MIRNTYIYHPHLLLGGVTRIIQAQVDALKSLSSSPITLFTGTEALPTWIQHTSVKVMQHPSFNYLDPLKLHDENYLRLTYRNISDCFTKHIQSFDLLHIHNPTLGKNPLVPLAAINIMEKELKCYVVYHIHDFAEDGRYDLWENQLRVLKDVFQTNPHRVLYPVHPRLLYMTINSRDTNLLRQANVPTNVICYVPNPVCSHDTIPHGLSSGAIRDNVCKIFGGSTAFKKLDQLQLPFFFYPVRAIKRKNLGEFLLLAALLPKACWAISLPPNTESELRSFLQWKDFITQSLDSIPIVLNIPQDVDFLHLIISATALVTTSITEGFGMTYLESVLYKKLLFGRNLCAITKDFSAVGLCFPHLYSQIRVPIKPFDLSLKKLVKKYYLLQQHIASISEKPFAFPKLGMEYQQAFWKHKVWNNTIDFASLDVSWQKKIILKVHRDPYLKGALLQINPQLQHLITFFSTHNNPNPKWTVEQQNHMIHNAKQLQKHYSLQNYQCRLQSAYNALSNNAHQHTIKRKSPSFANADLFVDYFSDLKRLYVLHQ